MRFVLAQCVGKTVAYAVDVAANGADAVMSAVLSGDVDIGFSGTEATIYVYNGGEKDYVINTLIVYSYTVKKNSTKKLLWACFGEEMVDNLKVNTKDLGKICPICGKRFKPFHSGDIDIYCSTECYAVGKKQYDREYRRKS